jgi:hypothetical protein
LSRLVAWFAWEARGPAGRRVSSGCDLGSQPIPSKEPSLRSEAADGYALRGSKHPHLVFNQSSSKTSSFSHVRDAAWLRRRRAVRTSQNPRSPTPGLSTRADGVRRAGIGRSGCSSERTPYDKSAPSRSVNSGSAALGTKSSQTLRRRGVDSNHQFRDEVAWLGVKRHHECFKVAWTFGRRNFLVKCELVHTPRSISKRFCRE